MDIIEWNDEYSVKIKSIDDQHKQLFTLLNSFIQNVNNNDNHLLPQQFNELKKYALIHFDYEERLLRIHHFPFFSGHITEHNHFSKKVLEIESHFLRGDTDINTEMVEFLKIWIIQHISGSDKLYADFLKKRGVV